MNELKNDPYLQDMVKELRGKGLRIIGLAGKARTGKTETAKTLSRLRYTNLTFAFPLKRAIEAMMSLPSEQLDKDYMKPQQVPGFSFG